MEIIPDFWFVNYDCILDLSIKEICKYVQKNTEYKYDPDNFSKCDYWQTPQETFNNGGDCEDVAILALAIIYKEKGIKGKLVSQYGKKGFHAYLKVNGTSYYNYNNMSDRGYCNFDDIPYQASWRR